MSYDCSINGCELTTSTRSGMWSHAKKHIRQAETVLGYETEDYDQVREALDGQVTPDGDLITPPRPTDKSEQTTLTEAITTSQD